MRRQWTLVISFAGTLACVNLAQAQFGRGAAEWTTGGGDGQRSSWVRNDPKISPESLRKPGFQLVWKVKLSGESKQDGLSPAVLLDRYIGYRGFRSLGFVAGSDHVFAIDTDLGRIEWQKRLTVTGNPASACSSGMLTGLTRPTGVEYPMANTGRGGGGGGRGGPARSGVGEPNAGAVTIVEVAAPRGGAPGAPGAPGGRAPNRGGGGGGGRTASFLYALSSDGMLHAMYVSNGEEPEPPVKFLPAGAKAQGLIVVDGVAYASTSQGCGGAPDGVWSLDLASKQVSQWKSDGAIAGASGPAFGPDGTLYVSTANGGLVSLAPKTLAVKSTYSGKQPLVNSPVLFQHKETSLIAATGKDGRILLLDSANLAAQPLAETPAAAGATGSLASWQDASGTRWILAPTANSVVAWKLVEQNGTPTLQSGWTSGNLVAPLTPMIVNGVIFVAAGGDARSSAMLYALDGATGKELWNSGKTMTSFVRGGGLAGGSSQLYLGTSDGMLYAFGFPIEH